MSELKLKGTIKLIGEKQTFDSGFVKVDFVLTTEGDYPQDVKFEIVKDKVDDFIKYNKVGKSVEVDFNIRGNEYNGKYYVSLSAWKVFSLDVKPTEQVKEVESDSLPF
jgi:non-homologous end joining protein Ku